MTRAVACIKARRYSLCLDGVELWIPQCPHCGKPAPTPPVSEDWKDAERWRFFCSIAGSTEPNEYFDHLPVSPTKAQLDAATDAAMQEDKP